MYLLWGVCFLDLYVNGCPIPFLMRKDRSMKRKILVTGGAGYIGSHTCKLLAEHGYDPITIDNLSNDHRWAVKWGELIIDDIHDPALLDTIFEHYQPLAVIHFAGYINARESLLQPIKFYQNNRSK